MEGVKLGARSYALCTFAGSSLKLPATNLLPLEQFSILPIKISLPSPPPPHFKIEKQMSLVTNPDISQIWAILDHRWEEISNPCSQNSQSKAPCHASQQGTSSNAFAFLSGGNAAKLILKWVRSLTLGPHFWKSWSQYVWFTCFWTAIWVIA